jgi:TolB-like protein
MLIRFTSHPLFKSFAILTLVLILFPTALAQQQQREKISVAVLDFDARAGITAGEAATLSDVFSAQLVETGEFTVVDRNRIKALLEEQGFQQSEACSQVECIVEAGRILKVEKMFAGTIGKVGRTFNVNVQVIDVTTAQILLSKSRQHSGEIDELLSDIIPEIAAEMVSEIVGKEVEPEVATSGGGGSWLWWVGGAVVLGGGAALLLMSQGGGDDGGGTTPPSSLPGPPPLPN